MSPLMRYKNNPHYVPLITLNKPDCVGVHIKFNSNLDTDMNQELLNTVCAKLKKYARDDRRVSITSVTSSRKFITFYAKNPKHINCEKTHLYVETSLSEEDMLELLDFTIGHTPA